MESKKDIGKLFRENLEQLDYTPSTKVWEQIELDLEEKKKKRRFFIWFFLASLLFCGLIIGVSYATFSGGNSITNKNGKENSISNEKEIKRNQAIIAEEENMENSNSKNSIEEKNSNATEVNKENSKTLLNVNTKKNKAGSKNNSHFGNKNKSNQNSALASTSLKDKRKNKNSNSILGKNSLKKGLKNSDKLVADAKKIGSKETLSNSDEKANTTKNNTTEAIEKRPTIDSLIATTNSKKENKDSKKEKDSLAMKDSVAEVKEESKEHEIVIAPYYGLNYNGYFGNFDAISSNTVLEKKAEMRNTFGIMVRWMFGNKLGIQVGAGKINSRYFSTVEKTGSLFINNQNVDTDIPINELNGIFVNETKVKITYESSYIEVPLEAYYTLRDKKIGFATSFGVSLLFGGKNAVFAESEYIQKMRIGTLSTASSSSFTGNAKLYLFYRITPSLQLDFYPSFQYQIMGNTDSSNYSSYFFSIRTGFSYKL